MARDDELSEFDEEMESIKDPNEQGYESLYKMVSNNKIAVSKKEGNLWHERLNLAMKETEDLRESWRNITNVYRGESKPSEDINKKRLRLDEQDKTFENLVWSNTNGISRETIMKLPHIEVTCSQDANQPVATAYEHLINNYMQQTGNCGLNCKEKLIKADISAQLTNRGIWRLDWTDKINADLIRDEIVKLENELAECKQVDRIKEIEGKLYSLNEKLDGSGFDGAQLTLVDPCKLFVDPNSQLESGLDADWMIEERLEYEHILKAKYGQGEGTVYAGDKGTIGIDSEQGETYRKDNGYDPDYVLGGDDQQYVKEERLKTVKTYYIWDRLKKRVYLYQDGIWDYPLWVWNDPYGLKQFFPYYILWYNVGATDNRIMSEAAYYLPLMNSINKINSQIDKARDRAFNVTLVDRNLHLEDKDLQNMTNGKPGYVQIAIPEGRKLSDVVAGMPTGGLENQLLFNKSDIYSEIQKMCSADAITRGEEYKTNTTNGAIQQYSQGKKVIIGIRVDRIMSFYIRVCKDILMLCLSRFDMNDLSKYCTPQDAQVLNQMKIDVNDPSLLFVADDTIEPTAASKKQEAVQLAQIMGQFAGATPAISIVMLKMMSRAFNELVITDEDWNMIFQMFQQQQMQAQQQAEMQQQQMAMQQAQGQAKVQGMQQANAMKQAQGQQQLQNMQAKAAQQQQAAQQRMVNQAANF